MNRIIVIGGGPAGMMSAIMASKNGQVTLIEKNEKLGKKLYISGKGRCNITNNCLPNEFINNIISNPKFIYSAINKFSPKDCMDFFENNGLNLKTERGRRVFPLSDKSSDVIKCFEKLLKVNNVNILLNTEVSNLSVENGIVNGVYIGSRFIPCDKVIVATGGISYPLTGSTGDGYLFAKKTGHNIIKQVPALSGLEIKEKFCSDVSGLSLKNVKLTAKRGDKIIFSEQGEMLFTHFGISGPIVLTCSSIINRENFNNIKLSIDFKPALSDDILDKRLIREFADNSKKDFANILKSLLPSSLISEFIKRCGINSKRLGCDILAVERERVCFNLKNFYLTLIGLRNIDEAIVTSGGIDVKQINPKTMESKVVKSLFFAGEVIDVDCLTGGYNIQTALSTGFVAGENT